MAVRYKRFGKQDYAYKIWNEKNPETGRWVQRSQYLGVVIDKENGIYERRRDSKRLVEREILDYGDSYLLHNIIEKLPIFAILKTIFGDMFDTVMALVFHRIIGGQAMRYAENWYGGNYISKLFPNADVTSQNISRVLEYLGRESIAREFFAAYIPLTQKGTSGVVIDSTGLPNEINMPITDWGHHNNKY